MFHLRSLLLLRKKVQNYPFVIFSLLFRKGEIKVKKRSGEFSIIHDRHELWYLLLGYEYHSKEGMLTIKTNFNERVLNLRGVVKDGDVDGIFLKEEYSFLNVKDKMVVDIGANIGDSTIFFLLKGAKEVISIEPNAQCCRFISENLRLNGFSERVIILNQGISNKDETVKVAQKIGEARSSSLKRKHGGQSLQLISINTLVNSYNIKSAVLKVDCEGCEYELFVQKFKEPLLNFSQIQIEYHYGPMKIVNFLIDIGFSVKWTKPIFYFNKYSRKKIMRVGYIYASKIYAKDPP